VSDIAAIGCPRGSRTVAARRCAAQPASESVRDNKRLHAADAPNRVGHRESDCRTTPTAARWRGVIDRVTMRVVTVVLYQKSNARQAMKVSAFTDRSIRAGLLTLAAVVVLAAPSAWADPPTRAARLSYVTGSVSLAPAGLPDEWGEAFVNRPLTVGDRLWADQGGRAELRVGSTALRIDGGTSLDILDLDARLLQVSIDQGRAQVRTRGGRGGDAEIDTPAAAIVLNAASDVRVDVDPNSGRTSVLVRMGRASIYTPSESFELASGESTRIDQDGRYYTIGRARPRDAFDQFAYSRDLRWREPRYVSVEMTGYEDLDYYGAWQPSGEYGNVWFPRSVAGDWAPYRDGRWVWVEPWGWSWVDNAPWGFAPFHYGRWVQVGGRWGWWPGDRVATPVYAPALVAFFGGDNLGVSVSVGGGAVGWFPLGYRDPYIPWYTASPEYRRSVNVAYVRDPVVLNQVVNVNVTNINVTNIRYAYREAPAAVTVVPRQVFVAAQPVRPAAVRMQPAQVAIANTNIVVGAAPVAPERQSLVGRPGRGDRAPRAERANKPVVAVNAPAAAAPRFEQRQAEASSGGGKPFEVKPLAPRDDRRDARTAGTAPGAAPGAAPSATTASTQPGRDVRVIKPAPPASREARDRGSDKGGPQADAARQAEDRGKGKGNERAEEAAKAPSGQQREAATPTPPSARTAPADEASRQAQDRGKGKGNEQREEAAKAPPGQQREAASPTPPTARTAPADVTPRGGPPSQAMPRESMPQGNGRGASDDRGRGRDNAARVAPSQGVPMQPERVTPPTATVRPEGPQAAAPAIERRVTPQPPALPPPSSETAQERRQATPPQGPGMGQGRGNDREERAAKAPASPQPQAQQQREPDRQQQAQPRAMPPQPQAQPRQQPEPQAQRAPQPAQQTPPQQAQGKGRGKGDTDKSDGKTPEEREADRRAERDRGRDKPGG
jgi:hypothetical protein